jgi:hypothetical protein
MSQRVFLFVIVFATRLAAGQAASSLAPPSKPATQTCTIEGKVVRADDVPLKNVSVTALPQQVQSGHGRPTSTLSDSDGKFVLRGLDPGLYLLEAQRHNFIRQRYGQRTPGDLGVSLALSARQHLQDVLFRMQPAAVISGRIFDDDTEPIVGVQVTALRWGYRNGHKDLLSAGAAITDDRGEYRIHQLPPGRYYLSAAIAPPGSSGVALVQSVGNPDRTVAGQPTYAPTFYPGTSELSGASGLDARAGDQLQNVSFRLITTAGVRVSGYVRHSFGEPARGIGVRLTALQQHSTYGQGLHTVTEADGTFQFDSVLPGSYVLSAMSSDGERPAFGRLELQVGNSEVNRVTLLLQTAIDIAGVVRIEGAESTRAFSFARNIRLVLQPQDDLAPVVTAAGNLRGRELAFYFRNVLDGDYTLRIAGVSEDYYMSSVRIAGREALDNVVPVRGRTGPLDLVFGNTPGQIEGSVLDANDQACSGARVVLVPEESRRKRLNLFKSVTTDQYGHFILRGVMLGTYKLFAWETIDDGAYEDPEFLSAYEALGATIEISPKERATRQLRLIQSSLGG